MWSDGTWNLTHMKLTSGDLNSKKKKAVEVVYMSERKSSRVINQQLLELLDFVPMLSSNTFKRTTEDPYIKMKKSALQFLSFLVLSKTPKFLNRDGDFLLVCFIKTHLFAANTNIAMCYSIRLKTTNCPYAFKTLHIIKILRK